MAKVVTPILIDKSAQPALTRSSKATYIDRYGDFRIAGNDVIRTSFVKQDGVLVYQGVIIEPDGANFIRNTCNSIPYDGFKVTPIPMQSQSIVVGSLANAFVLSFYGTGTITVNATGINNVKLSGKAQGERVWSVFRLQNVGASQIVSLTVNGDCLAAQLEPVYDYFGSNLDAGLLYKPTSWIPTLNSEYTLRSADVIDKSGIIVNTFVETTQDFSQTTAYAIGDRVVYDYYIFQSLTSDNLGNTPNILVDADVNWVKVAPSNKYASIDLQTDSKSISYGVSDISIVLKNTFITDAAAVDCFRSNDDARVHLTLSNWSQRGFSYQSKILRETDSKTMLCSDTIDEIFTGVFSDFGSVISLRIDNDENDIASYVGELLFGVSSTYGKTQQGLSFSIVDYSVKKTNDFGITTWNKRGFSKRVTADVFINKSEMNGVIKTISELRSQPTLWIFDDDDKENLEATVVFGAYNQFDMKINYPQHRIYNIEIEGMVI